LLNRDPYDKFLGHIKDKLSGRGISGWKNKAWWTWIKWMETNTRESPKGKTNTHQPHGFGNLGS
jgi:hypothetical protein